MTNPTSQSTDLEPLAGLLEASGSYKVLRRLVAAAVVDRKPRSEERVALLLDLETTGLDTAVDEVIEIGMVKATYDVRSGVIGDVIGTFGCLREPTREIPPEVTRITGIDHGMVAGKRIDNDELESFVEGADLAISHNAGYDRPIAERHFSVFEGLPWACSVRDIPWRDLGFESAKLGGLLAGFGLFHGAHRAVDDCLALAELLRLHPQQGPASAMSMLLSRARRPTSRIWAAGAPFRTKDVLKNRGYRFSPSARCWHVDLETDAEAAELTWLREAVYQSPVDLPVMHLGALDRYSTRAEAMAPTASAPRP